MTLNWRVAAGATFIGLLGARIIQASEPLAGIMGCRDIEEASARLACYDRETAALAHPGPASARSVTPARPAVGSAPAAAAPAAPVLTPEQQFGIPERKVAEKEVAAGTRAADASKIEGHLTAISQSADGRLVFTLDNAQVWRQLTPGGEMLAKVGADVTVSRGWLGSYWLQLQEGRGCKVTRLR